STLLPYTTLFRSSCRRSAWWSATAAVTSSTAASRDVAPPAHAPPRTPDNGERDRDVEQTRPEDRPVRGRSPRRARADGRDHQRRVPPAVPGVRRRAVRLRDDHQSGAGRAAPQDHGDDLLRPGRAPPL